MALKLTSTAFPSGGDIPAKYTCDGADVSPALSWSNPPQGTKTFALIADDPDAPSGIFTHWILYAIPSGTAQLPEGVPKTEQASVGRQGRNSFGRNGYAGPCPPPGKPHRYFFKLFALDAELNLNPGVSRADLERAIQGHILEQSEWMGRYRRKQR